MSIAQYNVISSVRCLLEHVVFVAVPDELFCKSSLSLHDAVLGFAPHL